ncbi:MAG: Mut7-C RNAse domain-containing protein [Acidobacteria bacterium]|nr:Mut7-C RNAse domain-containing protein [Acidobacteriota bacterium]
MLGRLARWLRILGHDVVYFHHVEDSELVDLAVREGRVLLTRDTRLVQRKAARGALLIHSHLLEEQLRQMVRWNRDALLAPQLCRRCLECNEATVPVEKSSLRGRVPAYVFETQTRFMTCPACGRIYWKATHVRDMLRRLRRSLS